MPVPDVHTVTHFMIMVPAKEVPTRVPYRRRRLSRSAEDHDQAVQCGYVVCCIREKLLVNGLQPFEAKRV